jgi:hypothetical protein
MRRQRVNYARILGIGLGISVVVHIAVIGLGRWSVGSDGAADGPFSVVSLPEPELEDTDAASASTANDALTASGGFKLSDADVQAERCGRRVGRTELDGIPNRAGRGRVV